MARFDVRLDEKLCKHINTYFRGASILVPIIMCLMGIAAIVLGVAASDEPSIPAIGIGAALLLIGIIWIVVVKNLTGKKGQEEVDRAIAMVKEQVQSAGCAMLNISPEEVNLADPLLICGPANEPTPDIDMRDPRAVYAQSRKRVSLFKKLRNKMKKKDFEPELIQKFGKDYKFRFSLVEVTCFFYGEKQLYANSVKVDLTTGYTYATGTYELFYEDINGIEIDGEKRSIKVTTGCKKQTQKVPFFKAIFCLYASGCSIRKTMVHYDDEYDFDNALKGMRTLIRERKNAK